VSHLTFEVVKVAAGIDTVHVPYKGFSRLHAALSRCPRFT
jgi:hypothetical protein